MPGSRNAKGFPNTLFAQDQPLPSSDCHMEEEERLLSLWTVMTAAYTATHCSLPKDVSRTLFIVLLAMNGDQFT